MAMRMELPDEMAERVEAAAAASGVRPEDFVTEAVEERLGTEADPVNESVLAAHDELGEMIFDGTLRAAIDAVVDDPDLAVT